MSGRITLSTTDEAESLYEQLENDIEKLYGGKSAFWRSCLMNYDDKSRIQAKIDLIEQRIEEKEKEIEDLKLQKKGLETELDEITEATKEDKISEFPQGDQEFWDKTIKKIFKRTSRDEPKNVERRWDKWFEGRYQLFVNKFSEIGTEDFKQLVLEKAEERGFEDEVKKLRD